MSDTRKMEPYSINICRGLTGCPSAVGPSLELKQGVEKVFERIQFNEIFQKAYSGNIQRHKQFKLAISCCPNGCSMPHIADIGIIFAGPVEVTNNPCSKCMACAKICQEKAISCEKEQPTISKEKCLFCSKCADVCGSGTIKKSDIGFRILVGGKLGRHPRLATEFKEIFSLEQTLIITENAANLFLANIPAIKRFAELFELYPEQQIYKQLVKK